MTSATITDVNVDKEDGYELTEDTDSLFWMVSDGKNEEKADTTKSDEVTAAVGNLAYDKFVDYNCTDDSKYGFDDPYAVITVKYSEEEATDETADEEPADSDAEESTKSEDADASDSSEKEAETKTVEKTLTIYLGDETGSDRYIKVNDSKEVYTITTDSLTTILDSTVSDFYNLTVSYVAATNLDSLEVQSADGDHTIMVVRETTKDDSDDKKETTETSYKLDGEELDESTFLSFYNKLINMSAQKRLDEEYTPEADPAYTFILKDTSGNETTVKYYEYDTNFYAAVVDDKVYLVNKMNVKELDEDYQKVINADKEENASDTDTESETTEEN